MIPRLSLLQNTGNGKMETMYHIENMLQIYFSKIMYTMMTKKHYNFLSVSETNMCVKDDYKE